MSMAGWGGHADTGFSGVPPEVRETVERWMDEGPEAVAADPPDFSHREYPRSEFRMARFLRPFAGALFGVFVLVALEAIMAQAGPLLLQISIDDGIQEGNRDVVVNIGILFGVLVPVSIAIGVVRTMASGRVGARVMAELRIRLFSHFQRLSIDFYTHERAGRLLSRMTREMLQAIALYEQSDSGLDLWPNAVERLERLVANAPAFLEARYNLARLLEVRPRPGAARAHWNALAKEAQMLPASIRTLVCEEQNISQYDQCESIQRRRAAAPPWQWPLRVTGFQTLSSSTQRAKLSGWRRQSFDWVTAKLSGQLYARPNGEAEVLVLDEFVQMQVLRSPAVRLQRLADYCPWPLGKRTVARGTVWSCDQWAALTRVDMVEELWWVAR